MKIDSWYKKFIFNNDISKLSKSAGTHNVWVYFCYNLPKTLTLNLNDYLHIQLFEF